MHKSINIGMNICDLLLEHSQVATPKNSSARSFGISLTHLYGYNRDDDVNNWDYTDDDNGNAVRYRYIVGPKYLAFLKAMMPQITAAGWHLTASEKVGRSRWQLVFEPILAPRTPRTAIFWHLTPQANVQSILSSGLQPRESRHGFKYPQPRVYLIREEKDAHLMADSFAGRDKTPLQYTVLKVDLRKAKGITLHLDPELKDVAVYATQPIPPQFLSLAHEVVPQRQRQGH